MPLPAVPRRALRFKDHLKVENRKEKIEQGEEGKEKKMEGKRKEGKGVGRGRGGGGGGGGEKID